MSFGKSSGSQTIVPTLSPEQNAMIAAQTGLFTGTVGPAYSTAVRGATDLYNATLPGVETAAGNLARTAGQAQEALGSSGETALRTGTTGLQNLFSPEYAENQLRMALLPGQQQYRENIAAQNAMFGGAGQIGSSRQNLANRQTAIQAQNAQQLAAAEMLKNIEGQRLLAGQSLIGAGQAGLTGAQQAAQTGLTAANAPFGLFNQYAGVLYGTPSASWNPNFEGTQARTTTSKGMTAGIQI